MSLTHTFSTLRDPLVQRARVIYALMMREARTRFGHKRLGYMWALFEPVMQLASLWLVRVIMFERESAIPGVPMPVFLLTGVFPFLLWRYTAVRGATAVDSNITLLTYPQVRPLDLVTARVLLEIATMIVVFGVLILLFWLFGGIPLGMWFDNLMDFIAVMGTLFLFSYGFAVWSAQIGRIWDVWDEIVRFSGRILWVTSGLWFTMDSVPPRMREVLMWNPLAHLVEWTRSACLMAHDSTLYNPTYVLSFGLGFLFLGLFVDWMLRLSGHSEVAS